MALPASNFIPQYGPPMRLVRKPIKLNESEFLVTGARLVYKFNTMYDTWAYIYFSWTDILSRVSEIAVDPSNYTIYAFQPNSIKTLDLRTGTEKYICSMQCTYNCPVFHENAIYFINDRSTKKLDFGTRDIVEYTSNYEPRDIPMMTYFTEYLPKTNSILSVSCTEVISGWLNDTGKVHLYSLDTHEKHELCEDILHSDLSNSYAVDKHGEYLFVISGVAETTDDGRNFIRIQSLKNSKISSCAFTTPQKCFTHHIICVGYTTYQIYLLTSGFLQLCWKSRAFDHMPDYPEDIAGLISSFISIEYIHLFTIDPHNHWKINIDCIINSSYPINA